MTEYLCKVAGVSRSGYYNYFTEKSIRTRIKRDKEDEIVRDNILKSIKFRNRKKGSRQIKMTLQGKMGINYNLKRISRIKSKYNIICPIRRPNPYWKMIKATKEHNTLPNKLNRKFKQNKPGKVLLTDITYLTYCKGKKRAYLSTILDGSTGEALAYQPSKSLELEIVTETLHNLIKDNKHLITKDAFIHSDYTEEKTIPKFYYGHCYCL